MKIERTGITPRQIELSLQIARRMNDLGVGFRSCKGELFFEDESKITPLSMEYFSVAGISRYCFPIFGAQDAADILRAYGVRGRVYIHASGSVEPDLADGLLSLLSNEKADTLTEALLSAALEALGRVE